MKIKQNNFGLTLMETLMYIAIIGILIVGLMSFSWTIANNRNKAYVSQEVQANVRMVTNLIKQKVRQADTVISPTSSNSADSLVLDMPSPDNDITFSVSNGTLQLIELGSPTNITSDRVVVSDLNFVNLSASGERDSIRITMTISYNGSPGDKIFNYSQDIQTAVSVLE